MDLDRYKMQELPPHEFVVLFVASTLDLAPSYVRERPARGLTLASGVAAGTQHDWFSQEPFAFFRCTELHTITYVSSAQHIEHV